MSKRTQRTLQTIAACVVALAAIISAIDQVSKRLNPPCVVDGQLSEAECNDKDLIEDAKRFDEVDPEGDGPWPFVVVGTGDLGLKVRTSNVVEGQQTGTLGQRNIAWVRCKAKTDFDPDPTRDTGPLWYAVRWPTDEPGTAFLQSEPSAPHIQWAFAGYLLPLGHNGKVPDCPVPRIGRTSPLSATPVQD